MTGLTNDTSYEFELRAVNAGGYSPIVPRKTATPRPPGPPARPNGLAASGGTAQVSLAWLDPGDSSITKYQVRRRVREGDLTAIAGDRQVTLSWPNPHDPIIVNYEYRYKAGAETYGEWTPMSGLTSTSFTVTGLTNDTQHTFQVRQVDVEGLQNTTLVSLKIVGAYGYGVLKANNKISLGWSTPTDSASITGWQYRQKTGAGGYGAWTDISGSDANTTLWETGALTAGTAYAFQVRPVRSGQSDVSVRDTWEFTALSGGSKTMTWTLPNDGFTLGYQYHAEVRTGSVTQRGRWANVPGSDRTTTSYTARNLAVGSFYTYRIRSMMDPNLDDATATPSASEGWTDISGSGANSTSTTASSLSAGEAYLFQVRAVNAHGDGPGSEWAGSAVLPAKPTGLSATPGDRSAALSWNHLADSTVDKWQYKKNAETDWTDVTIALAASPSTLTFATSSYDTPQTARVKLAAPPAGAVRVALAQDNVNFSPSTLTFTTQNWNTAQGVIVTLKTEPSATTTVSLSAGYWVNATGQVVTGLTNATAYTFNVRAVNEVGAGPASDASTAVTPRGAPAKPAGLRATGQGSNVKLDWTDPGDSTITGYEYRRKAGSGGYGAWTTIPSSGAATATYTVTGTASTTRYTFQVRARRGNAVGPASDEASSYGAARPAAPTGLAATVRDRGANLVWANPASVYAIQYSADGGTTWTDTNATIALSSSPPTQAFTLWDWDTSTSSVKLAAAPTSEVKVVFAQNNVTFRPSTLTFTTQNWNTAQDVGVKPKSLPYGGLTVDLSSAGWPNPVSQFVPGLSDSTTYTFRVRGLNEHGEPGPQSAHAVVTVDWPDAPTGLSAAPYDNALNLSWTDPNDATITRYEYRVTGGKTVPWTTIPGSGAATTTHTLTNLINGVEYTYHLRAVNGHGLGEVTSATGTPRGYPDAPTGLAAAVNDGQVALTWNDPGDSTIVKWEYSKDGGTNWADVTITLVNSKDEIGFDSDNWDTNQGFTTKLAAAPTGTVKITLAQPDAIFTPSTLTFTTQNWNTPQTVNVKLAENPLDNLPPCPLCPPGWTPVLPVNAVLTVKSEHIWINATAYTVTGLTNGTEYTLGARAVNDIGAGAAASIKATPTPPPAAPTGLAAVSGDGQVELSWSWISGSDPGVERYEYQERTRTGQAWDAWGTAWTDVGLKLSHTVTDLTNDTEYQFRVRGVNAAGAGAASAPAAATPRAPYAPQAPTGLAATGHNRSVQVTWTAPALPWDSTRQDPSVTGYKFRWKKTDEQWPSGSPYGWSGVATDTGRDTTRREFAGLENDTAYDFQVRAVNALGDGATSTVVTATTTNASVPGAPVGLAAASRTDAVALSWTLPAVVVPTSYGPGQRRAHGRRRPCDEHDLRPVREAGRPEGHADLDQHGQRHFQRRHQVPVPLRHKHDGRPDRRHRLECLDGPFRRQGSHRVGGDHGADQRHDLRLRGPRRGSSHRVAAATARPGRGRGRG